jgi:hypothetical protein
LKSEFHGSRKGSMKMEEYLTKMKKLWQTQVGRQPYLNVRSDNSNLKWSRCWLQSYSSQIIRSRISDKNNYQLRQFWSSNIIRLAIFIRIRIQDCTIMYKFQIYSKTYL